MSIGAALTPAAGPPWLAPLVNNLDQVPHAYRRRVPPELLAAVTGARDASATGGSSRDAAVLVLFSGPDADHPAGEFPADADLLLTVRADTLRHHAGQAAFPGGAADPTEKLRRRPGSSPAGFSRWRHWSECSSRPRVFTLSRYLRTPRIRGRWRLSTSPKPPLSPGFHYGRSSIRATG